MKYFLITMDNEVFFILTITILIKKWGFKTNLRQTTASIV